MLLVKKGSPSVALGKVLDLLDFVMQIRILIASYKSLLKNLYNGGIMNRSKNNLMKKLFLSALLIPGICFGMEKQKPSTLSEVQNKIPTWQRELAQKKTIAHRKLNSLKQKISKLEDEFGLDFGTGLNLEKGFLWEAVEDQLYSSINDTLTMSCKTNNSEDALTALAMGADIEHYERGRLSDYDRPLHWAAQYNSTDVAQLLLLAGADIDSRDYSNRTPIYDATRENNTEIALLLIAAGADTDLRTEMCHSPLELAIKQKNKKIIQAIKNRKNRVGKRTKSAAKRGGSEPAAKKARVSS